jgi:ferrochelatase
MIDSERPHLLLVNLGTPEAPTPESVREFLHEFLSDPAVVDLPRWLWKPVLERIVLKRRPHRVAEAYASIWSDEGSPLRVATERMVEAVRARADDDFTVSSAYRYGKPSLRSEMRRLAAEGGGPVVVLPLYPHRTDATTATSFCHAQESAELAGIVERFRQTLIAPDDPGFIAALADRWQAMLDEADETPEHMVISYHGIPKRYDRREKRLYTKDCAATSEAFLRATGWPRDKVTIAFQSKFGPEPWLTPATASVINELPKRGITRVGVITPGFLTDCLETLEEIGVRAREEFIENGGTALYLARAVEDHPAMIESLVQRLVGDLEPARL